jgi:hypothetical protein
MNTNYTQNIVFKPRKRIFQTGLEVRSSVQTFGSTDIYIILTGSWFIYLDSLNSIFWLGQVELHSFYVCFNFSCGVASRLLFSVTTLDYLFKGLL